MKRTALMFGQSFSILIFPGPGEGHQTFARLIILSNLQWVSSSINFRQFRQRCLNSLGWVFVVL